MKVKSLKIISWFAGLGVLVLVNHLYGDFAGEGIKETIFLILILLLAASIIALLLFQLFRSRATKTTTLAEVERAMEMEEEFKTRKH
jgi:hypothetical protein